MCVNNRTEETAPKMPQNSVYSKPKTLRESSRSCRQLDATWNRGRSQCLTTETRGRLKTQMAPHLSVAITYKRAKITLLGVKIENRAAGK